MRVFWSYFRYRQWEEKLEGNLGEFLRWGKTGEGGWEFRLNLGFCTNVERIFTVDYPKVWPLLTKSVTSSVKKEKGVYHVIATLLSRLWGCQRS
jgi:hypothetical protein